jgi:hypothetical protein
MAVGVKRLQNLRCSELWLGFNYVKIVINKKHVRIAYNNFEL